MIINKPFRPGDIKRSKANINKAKRLIKYKVDVNFFSGIKKYIGHLKTK